MNNFQKELLREFLKQLVTHEGRCILAEKVAKKETSIEEIRSVIPKKIQPAVLQQIQGIETLSNNPCSLCGTFKLEEDFVGSGCCSERCYDERGRLEADPFPPYEERPLQSYEAVKDLYIGPPVDIQLKAGHRIDFDGTYVKSKEGDWVRPPLGFEEGIKRGWLRGLPPKPEVRPESDDFFDDLLLDIN